MHARVANRQSATAVATHVIVEQVARYAATIYGGRCFGGIATADQAPGGAS